MRTVDTGSLPKNARAASKLDDFASVEIRKWLVSLFRIFRRGRQAGWEDQGLSWSDKVSGHCEICKFDRNNDRFLFFRFGLIWTHLAKMYSNHVCLKLNLLLIFQRLMLTLPFKPCLSQQCSASKGRLRPQGICYSTQCHLLIATADRVIRQFPAPTHLLLDSTKPKQG